MLCERKTATGWVEAAFFATSIRLKSDVRIWGSTQKRELSKSVPGVAETFIVKGPHSFPFLAPATSARLGVGSGRREPAALPTFTRRGAAPADLPVWSGAGTWRRRPAGRRLLTP